MNATGFKLLHPSHFPCWQGNLHPPTSRCIPKQQLVVLRAGHEVLMVQPFYGKYLVVAACALELSFR